MKFLKEFGIGIIFAICLPLLLVLVALVAVYGVIDFIVEFVIMLVNFFSGRKCFPVFEEDEEAYRRKQDAINASQPKSEPQPAPQPNIYVQQVYYNTNPNQANAGMPLPQGIPQSNIPFEPSQLQQAQSPEPINQYISNEPFPNMSQEAPIEQIPSQESKESDPVSADEEANDD